MYLRDKLPELEIGKTPEGPPDVFSLDALIAWLRTKPADETYCYGDTGHCLVAQYLKERCGYLNPSVGSYEFSDGLGPETKMPAGWDRIAGGFRHDGRTFGAALTRALALRSQS